MDEFDQAFAQLKRSPFGEVGANDVFEQAANMPTLPTSGIEDIGFTPEQLALLRNGIYNGDFRTPPPEGDGVELDDLTNKLPGWSYVKTGTAVTAKWVDDSAGGNVTFTVAAGAATTDSAYIEQIIPVTGIGKRRVAKLVSATATVTEIAESDTSIVAQYLDADGATTGTASTRFTTSESGATDCWTVCPNGEAGIPTDGYYLRIRINVADIGAGGDTVVIKDVFVEDRLNIPGNIEIYPLTGNSNAFTAGSTMHETQLVVLLPDGAYEIRGINSTGSPDGRLLWLYNLDATNSVTLVHESTSATSASYRIQGPNNADVTIRPRGGVMLVFFGHADGTNLRWHVLSQV